MLLRPAMEKEKAKDKSKGGGARNRSPQGNSSDEDSVRQELTREELSEVFTACNRSMRTITRISSAGNSAVSSFDTRAGR